jgi:hypothetical protein
MITESKAQVLRERQGLALAEAGRLDRRWWSVVAGAVAQADEKHAETSRESPTIQIVNC